MANLTFRSSKIIYYGPHACDNCGDVIVRAGREFGGNAFNQPEGPIYPNTEWHVHICDPRKSKTPADSRGRAACGNLTLAQTLHGPEVQEI